MSLEQQFRLLYHLDHGTYEGSYKCIEAGFSSIMFDGSKYPIEENVAKTKELIEVCNKKGISLEAEVGSIGGEEDGVIGQGECADPNECKHDRRPGRRQCWQQVSVTFTENILQTGQD